MFLTGDNVRVRLKDMTPKEQEKVLSNEGYVFAKVEIDEIGGEESLKAKYPELQVMDTGEEAIVEAPKPPTTEELMAKLAEMEAKLLAVQAPPKPSEPVKAPETPKEAAKAVETPKTS
jgi:hypothetical protein